MSKLTIECDPGAVKVKEEDFGSDTTVSLNLEAGQRKRKKRSNLGNVTLIRLIRSRPVLWHRDHHKKRGKDVQRSWEDIRRVFGRPDVKPLKIRWRDLRNKFRRESLRIAEGKKPGTPWDLYKRLTFLLGHFRSNGSRKTNNPKTKESESVVVDLTSEDEQVNFKTEPLAAPLEAPLEEPLEERERGWFERTSVDIDQPGSHGTRSPLDAVERDSDYNFLMSLYPFMRNLPDCKNMLVRAKFQQVIAEMANDDSERYRENGYS